MFSYKIKNMDTLSIVPGAFKVTIFNTLTRKQPQTLNKLSPHLTKSTVAPSTWPVK